MQLPAAGMEHRVAAPAPELAHLVSRSVGYHYSGLAPGIHLGLPSPSLTLVVSLGPRTRVARMPDPSRPPAAFSVLIGGLHSRPAVLSHEGELFGIQLALTPEGARALLGLPAGELSGSVLGLDDVVGRATVDGLEAAGEARSWPQRFAMVEQVLSWRLSRAGSISPVRPELQQAWRLILSAAATPRISQVARTVGWSRRHLLDRFLAEYGVGPKQLHRIARFHRSKQVLQRSPGASLAEVAAACGYFDQSHLAREWNQLAGCAPSRWLSSEQLSFVQDEEGAWEAG